MNQRAAEKLARAIAHQFWNSQLKFLADHRPSSTRVGVGNRLGSDPVSATHQ
jgi:hypothetical protein